ncbi:uncharacterized protein LOC110008590 isoform X2 [Jatropha curcas]|uniref:uncharacterized protein LOC110008590 isoform X2 n=1 Tax=Jatropha curcas TaxID=180498 RepID=UPI0005FB5862|nr:uncharacterized protein LOC110008590 isoform X2 [Jatropha curcas]
MASQFSLQLLKPSFFSKSFGSKGKKRMNADVTSLLKLNGKELGNSLFQRNNVSIGLFFAHYASSVSVSLRALTPLASSASAEETDGDNNTAAMGEAGNKEVEFNRVNCLVWVLHESAASFSLAVQSLGLAGSSSELTMAWNGKDVHEWHKRIAYQVAVYALLKTAIEVEMLLSLDRHKNAFPVKEILTSKINLVGEYIESLLNMKHAHLVQWFRVVELPRIVSFFTPLLKKWSMEYAGSGVAGIIVATSCCAAVGKLGSGRISCPLFIFSIEDVLIELLDLSHSLVEVDKLHQLATEAGFELNFLFHFGAKFMPCNKIEELEFWIGLAQQKLSAALYKEILVGGIENSHENANSAVHESLLVQADSLATLGLFTYLGKKTRLFLSKMSVKDLDELVKDFLNYLECGILFTHPELASISAYESFMEVVTEEIGWLDFYATCFPLSKRERKRSKQHPIQAEKEIILFTVFTVCYDVFSGFAHFSRSTQQSLDAESLEFLLRSQSLLTVCLEDYRAVYDRYPELRKIAEVGASDHTLSVGIRAADKLSVQLEAQQRSNELTLQGCLKVKSREGNPRKVSAVGHAAMLAAIQRYMPRLIPSPYSSERLDVVKQLNRAKKIEVLSLSNLQDPSCRINLEDPSANSDV